MTEDDVPQLDIPRPCPVAWSAMNGANAARTCDRCQRVVHDFSALSATQIQALMSDPSKRVCARMDWSTVQRLGASSLKALALSMMLTTVGVAAAPPSTDASTNSPTIIRGVVHDGDRPLPDVEVRAKRHGRGKETVTLVRSDDGLRRTSKTDAVGGYSFTSLKPGHYELTGAAKGFVTGSISLEIKTKPRVQHSSHGPSTIGPGDLDGDLALCPQQTTK